MRAILSVLCLFLISAGVAFAQAPSPREEQPEFLKQGQQLLHEGKLDDALALYRQTLQSSPDSLPALIAAGSVLDLMGRGEEARTYFEKAINAAGTPENKATAERAMAISYAFDSDCPKTVEHEQKVFGYFASVKNFYQQGEIADEAARVCLESGDSKAAYHWYSLGHDIGLDEPNITSARADLWSFRWEHALARIAARSGNHQEALNHVAAAKVILEKGTNPEQTQFLPYLEGYVAFYANDYNTALTAFLKANQKDPFIQCLIAQTYEKLGDKQKALDYYQQASKATSHNPPAAYAVPFSRKKLASLQK